MPKFFGHQPRLLNASTAAIIAVTLTIIVVFAVTTVTTSSLERFSRMSATTLGFHTGAPAPTGGKAALVRPHVYEYSVDGAIYEIRDTSHTSATASHSHAIRTIRYNPDNPAEATVEDASPER